MTEVKKKRGRKPKNHIIVNQKNDNNIIDNINSEDEKIIFHLPITIDEINNYDNNDNNDNNLNFFIKSELDIDKINKNNSSSESDNKLSDVSDKKIYLNKSVNNINTHILKFNSNTKCWWCKNCFTTHAIQLPDDYYNNIFFCIGNYCSYNCALAYNIDLNDLSSYKRTSLLNFLYYKTYLKYTKIISAPHWITLHEYGGNLSIEDFREFSINNTKEYLVLHPPIISRQMQIEESYRPKIYKDTISDSENKYIIKRNKPINNKQMSLEVTMGLIKKIK